MHDAFALGASLLDAQTLCVLSTLGPAGEPHSALVAFSRTPSGEFVIGTSSASRKFANLLREERASIVVHSDEEELQVEGTARIAEGEEEERCRAIHAAKNPRTAKYLGDPTQRFVVVTPAWARYTSHATDPHTVLESRF